MTCERAKELLIDSLVETLDDDRLAELKEHLAGCESCAEEAAGYEHLWRCLDTVAVPQRRADSESRLQESVRREFGIEIGAAPATSTATGRPWPGWKIAASLSLIALGSVLTIGLQNYFDTDDPGTDDRGRYLLIMTDSQETPAMADQVRQEFQAWVAELIDQGIMETGIGLAAGPPTGIPPQGPLMDDAVSGFIVIRAADAQEALRISLSSPLLDYGGLVDVRELDGDDTE